MNGEVIEKDTRQQLLISTQTLAYTGTCTHMQAYPTHEHVLTTYTYTKNNPHEVMVTEAVRNPILDVF